MPTRGESSDIGGTVTATGKNPMKAAIEPEFGARISPTGTGLPGVRFYPGYLDRADQERLVAAVRQVFAAAPLFTSRMPKSGRPMSVRMSNCGPLGWLSDERGYRYEPTHPGTGRPWPPIPDALIAIWNDIAQYPQPPEACLINFYGPAAKMGLHQDRDEAGFRRAGGFAFARRFLPVSRRRGKRSDPTHSFRLNSGDAVVLGGDARLAFHGVDRIYPGTSTLLAEGGRINLTMRRVTRPAHSQPRRPDRNSPRPTMMHSSNRHRSARRMSCGCGFRHPGLGNSGARGRSVFPGRLPHRARAACRA